MKLRTKILLAQLPMVLAVVLMATAAVLVALHFGGAPGAILHENFRSYDAGRSMLIAADTIDQEVTSSLSGNRAVDASIVERALAEFESELSLQVGNITEPGETGATVTLQVAWDRYRAGLQSGGPAGMQSHAQRSRALRLAVDRIFALNREAMRDKSEASREMAKEVGTALIVTALLGLGIALGVTGLWLSRLLSPLGIMDHAVKRIAAGDFDAHICVQGHDEIASLALSVNDMAGRIKQYKASSLGELLQANDRLRSVMDSLADAVIVYDIAGMPVTQNKVAQDLFGPGETSLDEFPEPLRGVIADAFDRVRRERDAHMPTSLDAAVELEGRRGPTWVIVSSTPVIRHDGLLRGVTISLRDVTKARRLDGFRGDLVAATAHELRTPLTSLHMAVHLCLEGAAGPLTERQAGLLTTARDDCQRLQEVVEELLEMARLESGYMRLHRIPMRVVDLVSDAVARHQSEARATGTSIMTDSSEASLTVDVDPERLRHVFDNLLENAMVHGGAQSIISVGFEASDREVRVYVDDGGPGIAPDLRERVFGKFFRVPGTRAPGTGLGLSIVRDVVRAHDGTVGIETSPAGGARMWFSVPRSSNTHV